MLFCNFSEMKHTEYKYNMDIQPWHKTNIMNLIEDKVELISLLDIYLTGW